MKQVISKLIQDALKKEKLTISQEEIEKYIEIPPSIDLGDFAFPCFILASRLKKDPKQIALKLREVIGEKGIPKEFEEIESEGPYLNFFVDKKIIALNLIKEVSEQKENYGKNNSGNNAKIIVEFSSPNIAKPFGIGHLRSTIIGNSIANICEFNGYKTIRMNYLGDWGTQFGKLIFGYKKFGSAAKLKKEPIKHLLEIYVKANDEKYEDEARQWFKKLEQGDEYAVEIWNKFKDLSIKEFAKIYSMLNIKFDIYLGESMYNQKIPKVIEELKSKNILIQDQGALIVDLKKYNLGVCLIEKSDGSTIYAARDITSAIDRKKDYDFSKMIYEVGQEQQLHFQQVFKVLELMGYDWAKNCIHAEHGLYMDKDGKKFATRKGKTIFMEDIFNETKKLASKEIKKRFPKISKKELDSRAHKVAIGAVFYGDLKNNRTNNMIFDIKRFVSFEGDTGPYIQYSYARANSILKKSKNKDSKIKIDSLEPKEIELIKKLAEFKTEIEKAYLNLNPSIIAHYSYQLAQIFNEFYHECPVINSDNEVFRLKLVETFKQVLKNSLGILGIDVLEEM